MLAALPYFLIVVSSLAWRDPSWRGVAEALAARHVAEAQVELLRAPEKMADFSLPTAELPRYVAFVMTPGETGGATFLALKRRMRTLDGDPYEDALWSVLSGATADEARAMVLAPDPNPNRGILATSRIDPAIVPGRVTALINAEPKGRWLSKGPTGRVTPCSRPGDDVSDVFANAWDAIDPAVVIAAGTSTAAGFDMPFGYGRIVARNGRFGTASGVAMNPAREPRVWIAAAAGSFAAGGTNSAAFAAIGFGKTVQLSGPFVTGGSGETGRAVRDYFIRHRQSLSHSHYFACQHVMHLLPGSGRGSSFSQKRSHEIDAQVLWGDPLRVCALTHDGVPTPGATEKLPLGIFFETSRPDRRLLSAPEGYEVMVADDFALVTKWPVPLPSEWRGQLVFSE